MKERQVIATWYTPEEKLPESDMCVLATVNAASNNLTWLNSFMLLEYSYDDQCWYPWDSIVDLDSLEVIAWCDIAPY